ncbi:hypothetical protein AGR6A_Lc90135 [Agrobacterium sp. NCPPB 925]|nr:hypothetical protein AGR6A_Lc90135 [Agrobacterium sp. NCPPB 925]
MTEIATHDNGRCFRLVEPKRHVGLGRLLDAIVKFSPDGRRIRRNSHALRRLRGADCYRWLEYQPDSKKEGRGQTDSAARYVRANLHALRLLLFQHLTCRFDTVYPKYNAIPLLWAVIFNH